jgi:hypothetical protein
MIKDRTNIIDTRPVDIAQLSLGNGADEDSFIHQQSMQRKASMTIKSRILYC